MGLFAPGKAKIKHSQAGEQRLSVYYGRNLSCRHNSVALVCKIDSALVHWLPQANPDNPSDLSWRRYADHVITLGNIDLAILQTLLHCNGKRVMRESLR